MSKLNDISNGIGNIFKDAGRDLIDEKVNIAIKKERKNGIEITIETLIEAGIKDAVIINLLEKYWGLLDDEPREAVRYIKTFEYPYKALTFYLKGQGYTSTEVEDFMNMNHVRIKLRHNRELSKLSPEKLMHKVTELK
ncbi:hypothetical protein [Acetobacterium bakii]|uniref:Uncharacterized protein n=1 Tax=Acetobacterium bakii TaxID=52689 RepID=A0A0L6U050_9FIRM|nr:hypothetical protein [Acetobacterium bakii]KNZ41858.1 hypothetical protein AKG39_09575 [Acetobacterium bakii]